MGNRKRPKSLILLLIFFGWVGARALGWIVFPVTSGSYHFYRALGQPWLHYVSESVTVALATAAAAYLWRPKRGWLAASLVALGVLAVSGLAEAWYAIRHLEVARLSYASSRAARGLPVPSERLAENFSPGTLWAGTLAMCALFALLAVLAWRSRGYAAADA